MFKFLNYFIRLLSKWGCRNTKTKEKFHANAVVQRKKRSKSIKVIVNYFYLLLDFDKEVNANKILNYALVA